MTDYFKDEFTNSENSPEENKGYEDIFSASETPEPAAPASQENSYEWNAEGGDTQTSSSQTGSSQTGSSQTSSPQGEYHYSYVNGNNSTAPHNPNNYENAYSGSSSGTGYVNTGYNPYSAPSGYAQQPRQNQQSAYSSYNSYSSEPSYGEATAAQTQTQPPKKEKKKKEKKPASRGFIAAMLAVTMVASAALGFGGGFLAKNLSSTTSGNLTINQVQNDKSITNASSTTAATTSEIVKKTADSVVEIATEGVTTGTFARQYVTKGAGSGVIISKDGYIVTNHHVIENTNSITVTLRDGTTSYKATLIGSDEENDVALLKIDADDLTPAVFGDSSALAVGDYVVAIGNPLGTLGGTVTDGIISALAREVTIEGQDMTLLQTNAQISPGNSGGGLFNANGELIGIVNAKDAATEVEGIAFAIPVNNVLDIIKDLQNYGYVTGKIDLGMKLVDVTSSDTAFYYGVNKLGCYVTSVDLGSNADTAGFRRGDLISEVNGTKVSTSAEIDKALENNKVGDTVDITVTRSGQSMTLKLTLAEYVPSAKLNDSAEDSQQIQQYQQGQDIWDQLFGW